MKNDYVLDKPQYFGSLLHKRGFKDWFIYMFRTIEGKKFVVEELHKEMFKEYQAIYDMEVLRLNVNVPPRSAKTTFCKYLIAYALAVAPDSEFIYTSFSQDLLDDISRQLQLILNHKAYRSMYGLQESKLEDVIADPISSFWSNYLDETQGKEKFSNRKIITSSGGIVYFASMGSNITGMGAGKRNAKNFSGCLFIDDPNKPAEVRSETIRERVHRYYDETLLSRLNSSYVPIVNVQQRLHEQDLTGYLNNKYKFKTFKMPLVDEKGVCCLPSQYTEERIKELKVNDYLFLAQYQQQPIRLGGNIIKTKWYNFYDFDIHSIEWDKLFMIGDTAQKIKEHNDYSVFSVWGVYQNNLYLLDIRRGKWEAPDLIKQAKGIWTKWEHGINGRMFFALYVEDKSSGTGLIQTLKIETSIPVVGVERVKDKLTRIEDVLHYIESGRVYLPVSKDYSLNKDLIAESESFSRDMSHKHDDILDTMIDAINKGLNAGKVSIWGHVH